MTTPPSEPSPPDDEAQARERERALNTSTADSAWRIIAYLLSGPLFYGGIGYLLDRWLGTGWIVGAGIVVGMALSLYLVWFRYGTH